MLFSFSRVNSQLRRCEIMRPAVVNLLEMSSGDAFKFPKLNGQNYVSWSVHMQSVLQSKYLWLVVKGMETCPAGPDAAPAIAIPDDKRKARIRDYLDWVSRDEAAQGLMHGATDETQ